LPLLQGLRCATAEPLRLNAALESCKGRILQLQLVLVGEELIAILGHRRSVRAPDPSRCRSHNLEGFRPGWRAALGRPMKRRLTFRFFGEIEAVSGAVTGGGAVRRTEEMGRISRTFKEGIFDFSVFSLDCAGQCHWCGTKAASAREFRCSWSSLSTQPPGQWH
jgi:hypothetical protein